MPAIRRSGGTLRAIHSATPARAAELARRHGIAVVRGELAELLEDPDLDAVFISSRNDRHHGEVLAAAAAGRHILCEKPIALSVLAAREMVRAAHDAGVVLAVNHQQREQAPVRALRDLVRAGTLGELRAMRVAHAGRLREDLRTWRLREPGAGAGVELDLTVHDADLLRFLLDDEVREVSAMSAAEDGAAASTHTVSTVRMIGGLLVGMHEGFNVPCAQPSIEIHGERATAICIGHTAQVAAGELWLTRDQGRTRDPVAATAEAGPYDGVIRAFTAAVLDGRRPSASGEDGLRSVQVALAIRDAGASGERVAIDLDARSNGEE